jgi:O-antigen/teichoic acid export membrane protein
MSGIVQCIWAVLTQVLIMLSGIVSSVVLNRALQPEGRGDVAMAMLWPMLFGFLLVGGIESAIKTHVSRTPQDGCSLWAGWALVSLGVSIPAMAAGYFLTPFILVGKPEIWSTARWFLLFIPFNIVGCLAFAVLEALGRFDLTAHVRVGSVFCILLLVVTLGEFGLLAPNTYLMAMLAIFFAGNAYPVWLLYRLSIGPWKPRLFHTAGYALKAAPLGWSQVIRQRVDLMMIAALAPVNSAAIGVYVAGVTLGGLVAPFAMGFSSVLLPKSAQRSAPDAVLLFGRMGRAFILATTAVSLPLFFGAEWLLSLAYGEEFRAGAPAVRIALLNTLLGGLNAMGISALQGMNRPGAATVVGVVSCIVATASAALLLPCVGYLGAAYGQALGIITGLLLLQRALHGHGFSIAELIPRWTEMTSAWTSGWKLLDRLVRSE